MDILVTGGAGFIGSHLCDALLAKGENVICVDNFNDYYDVGQKEENIKEALANENYRLYRKDITDYDAMKEIFTNENIDKIVHLAARAGVRPSIKDPLLYEKVNMQGTMNLLELAKKFNIKNFIFASSSSVYGVNKKIPFAEKDFVDNSISPYAATKKAGELICYTYHHLYDLSCICLRFFTVYGPRGRPDMAPYIFTKKIAEGEQIERYGNGASKRDYTYVSDIIAGIIAALNIFGYEIVNLGNNKPIELNQFISIIESVVGKKADIRQLPMQQGDVPITYADITKAQKLMGYSPCISIEEGMKKFWNWYQKQTKCSS